MWASLIFSALLALLDLKLGMLTQSDFFLMIVLCGISAIFPYKIERGSNAARWVYVVLTVGALFLEAGAFVTSASWEDFIAFYGLSRATLIGHGALWVISIGGIIPLLFSTDANRWFRGESTVITG